MSLEAKKQELAEVQIHGYKRHEFFQQLQNQQLQLQQGIRQVAGELEKIQQRVKQLEAEIEAEEAKARIAEPPPAEKRFGEAAIVENAKK